MDDDDDDEFGGLYTDILRPAADLPPPYRPPSDPITGGNRIPLRNPSSNFGTLAPVQTLAPSLIQEPNDDWLPDNWNDEKEEEDDGLGGLPVAGLTEVVEEPRIRVPVEEFAIGGDLDQELVIPGLSSAPIPTPNGIAGDVGNPRILNSEDWDSDSEDDLKIVLNDSSHHQHPMMMEDDEDGEEDLVIVTDGDQQLLHHPSMEEQDWGEGDMAVAPPVAGERREGMDLAKANGSLAPGVGPRVGYSGGHPFQPQHHSMYKYIRPGGAAAPPVVGSVGPPGQIRPPPFVPVAGRGRGDWRPPGIRGISNTQKSFHSGMPPWANSSSGRGFGGGLDFTLPSHKTVFEVDIESFEEKTWRHPGADISDYFNFGLDEDNWKDYCRQLDQHRVASTMQSKIHVYESGRSDQDFDPDLPPELAAAAGHHDISADNLQYGKIDKGQVDLSAQGVIPFIRPALPTGRAIQVETGSGERLPSMDTRPPRTRDADAIIEIVLQDSIGDSAKYNGAQAENDIQGEPLERDHDIEERHGEREYIDGFSQKEMDQRRIPSASEGDGILPFPSELPHQYHRNSKTRSPINAGGSLSTRHGGRLRQGTSHGRCSSTSSDNSNDAIGSRRAQVNKHDNHQKERLGDSMGGNQTPEISPAIAMGTDRELRIEQTDDSLALGESVDVEGEETSDFRISGETLGDDNNIRSRKQKLTSQVEPVIKDNDDTEDFRATHSDSSRAKSGSSKGYRKQRDNGEEVVQDGRSRRSSDMRKNQEEEHTIRRKDDYGRQNRHEMDKIRMSSKGREAMHHSYPYREWESNSAHSTRGRSVGFERPRESDNLFRQRRDDDIHRRVKDDDIRREHIEETGSRNRSKIRLGDRNDKEDDIHTKRRVDDVDWQGRHREGVPRQRERDNVLMNRRENLDDQVKRKKDDDDSRREKIEKEDTLPAYRAREDSSHRKRERDDVADRRRREETSRIRDKPDDHHSSKQKDESWRQREREDRQRLKPPHEDSSTHCERGEGVGAAKSRRLIEDKPLGGNGRSKTDSKGIGSDKDYLHREKRRQSELSKKGDLEDNNPLHKVRDDVHAREKRYNTEERGSKHERLSIRNDRSTSASDNQHMSRERAREGTRKSKYTEGSGQNPQVGKRKHEDHVTQQNERVSSKGTSERENINAADSKKGPQLGLSSEIHVDAFDSDDENQQETRSGRSKLERWTSHEEREYIAPNTQAPPSNIAEEVEDADNAIIAVGELPKVEGKDGSDLDAKGGEEGQISEKMGDGCHLDTVAKLKKRSERFKLPMPGDKDATVSKKPESELQPTQAEGAVDSEVKPERPARKRRWTSS